MAQFQPAFEFLLPHEGGYVNDPDDHGGETNFGISKVFHPSVDIKNLTVAEAGDIYRREYWRFDGIASQQVANKIFDMCVDMGTHEAITILQRCLSVLGVPVVIDGKYGPKTQAAVNGFDADELVARLRALSCCYYEDVVERNPTQLKFLHGWIVRARS